MRTNTVVLLILLVIFTILPRDFAVSAAENIRCEFSCHQIRYQVLGPINFSVDPNDHKWRDWCGNGSLDTYHSFLRGLCGHFPNSELTFDSEMKNRAIAHRCDPYMKPQMSLRGKVECFGPNQHYVMKELMTASTSEGRVAAVAACQSWCTKPTNNEEACKISEVTCWTKPL